MIAVIGGTGHQGFGLAVRWAASGIPVVIGSRSLDRARAAAEEVRTAVLASGRGGSAVAAGPRPVEGPRGFEAAGAAGMARAVRVEGLENLDAARAADVAVITVPAAAHAETLHAIAAAAAGKVVVDVTVPLDKNPAYAVQWPEGSVAEAAQRALGEGARVVGAFHTVPAALLRDLARPVDCDVLVCGDDAQAKARVAELAAAFGARAVDVGALRQAHTLERLTALLIGTGRRLRRHELGVRITGL